jgi:hypothetical protein
VLAFRFELGQDSSLDILPANTDRGAKGRNEMNVVTLPREQATKKVVNILLAQGFTLRVIR